MDAGLQLLGTGHSLGSEVVNNTELARGLGLSPDWLTRRTGIEQRRIAAEGENGVTLAADAIRAACASAGLVVEELGQETVLLHVQSGPVAYTPPAAAVISAELGMKARVLGLDGACAEPLVALDLAHQQFATDRCERVVLSASADFQSMINPSDHATVGLFGSGAGALVIGTAQGAPPLRIRGLHWESHPEHAKLGQAMTRGVAKHPEKFTVDYDYYTMDGQALAMLALEVLPPVVSKVLAAAGWDNVDVDLVLAHQPNARMLELGAKRLGFDLSVVPMPVKQLGNMGSASLLVNLCLARDEGRLAPGTKVLMLAFGLGFTCGAAALEF